MADEKSKEEKLIEKLRKTSSSKLWWPSMIFIMLLVYGMSGFVSWMTHQSRDAITNAVALSALNQARVECANYIFGLMFGLVVAGVVVAYAVRRKNRLLVSMYDRIKALEEKNAG
jgi:hypothetical protein